MAHQSRFLLLAANADTVSVVPSGTLAATETGADTSGITGGVAVSGPLSATESTSNWAVDTTIGVASSEIGWGGHTLRIVIAPQLFRLRGTKIRLRFKGATSGTTTLDKVYIGYQAAAGNAYDAAALTQVTFSGGSASVSVAANTTSTSDEITFAADATQNKALILSVHFTGTTTPASYLDAGDLGQSYYRSAVDDAATLTPAGAYTSVDRLYIVDQIEVLTPDDVASMAGTVYAPVRTTQVYTSALVNEAAPPDVRTSQVYTQALTSLTIPNVRATQVFTQALATVVPTQGALAGVETGQDTAAITGEAEAAPASSPSSSTGGGWLPPQIRAGNRRLERERAEDEELERRAREGYARAHGEAQETPEAEGAPAHPADVQTPPTATPEALAALPSLDWEALQAELEALESQVLTAERMARVEELQAAVAAMAELRRREDEDDEDLLLLFAA